MPVILAVLGALVALSVWYWRFKMMREASGEILDMAQGVRAAARRFAYRRRHNVHPAESVEDARLAAAGIMAAVAQIDAPLSKAEIEGIAAEARRTFNAGHDEAQEIAAFGRWIAGQCGSSDDAVRRLLKAIHRHAEGDVGDELLAMVRRVAAADGNELTEGQEGALATIARSFERSPRTPS
ncbi:MAG: hypothetical protein AAF844_06680 [Pseudomonadota bacterium]